MSNKYLVKNKCQFSVLTHVQRVSKRCSNKKKKLVILFNWNTIKRCLKVLKICHSIDVFGVS